MSFSGAGRKVLDASVCPWSWHGCYRTEAGVELSFRIFASVAGVAAEVLLVRKGIFAFSDQTNQLFGVATWLPWIYMAGGPAAGRFIELKGGAP